MRRGLRRAAVAAGATMVLAGGAIFPSVAGADAPVARGAATTAPFPHMDHVFVIMMENSSYSSLMSASNTDTSYIRQLAGANGPADHYYGGNTWGSNNDDPNQVPAGDFNHVNLADQFDQAGVSWKGYMQSLPGAGFTGASSPDGLYVRDHDPFMMFPDVYDDPARADHVVPLSQLAGDLRTGHVPQFSWISPNVCDDMHGGGHVPMIVVSRSAAKGRVDTTPANHYSLLRTIEANWDLGFLGNAGDSVRVHSLAPLLQPGGPRRGGER